MRTRVHGLTWTAVGREFLVSERPLEVRLKSSTDRFWTFEMVAEAGPIEVIVIKDDFDGDECYVTDVFATNFDGIAFSITRYDTLEGAVAGAARDILDGSAVPDRR